MLFSWLFLHTTLFDCSCCHRLRCPHCHLSLRVTQQITFDITNWDSIGFVCHVPTCTQGGFRASLKPCGIPGTQAGAPSVFLNEPVKPLVFVSGDGKHCWQSAKKSSCIVLAVQERHSICWISAPREGFLLDTDLNALGWYFKQGVGQCFASALISLLHSRDIMVIKLG